MKIMQAISKRIILKYLLSRTVFQLSRSICQIIAFDKGMYLVNALILYNLFEYLHRSSMVKKVRFIWGIWLFRRKHCGSIPSTTMT